MTDAEWEVLGPQARAVMAELRRGPGGRPMTHRLRVVVDAIRYLVRYGVEWRALPADFPPWQAVYAFFERWAARGLPQRVVDRLRGQLRVGAGRAETPTAAVIDSQSVKAADTVGAATSGFDGGKKIKGRKRHVAVDSNGWLLAVLVTAANVQDRDAGHRLVALLRERFSTITLVWADGGYAGRLVAWAATVLALTEGICDNRARVNARPGCRMSSEDPAGQVHVGGPMTSRNRSVRAASQPTLPVPEPSDCSTAIHPSTYSRE
jgi:transposase